LDKFLIGSFVTAGTILTLAAYGFISLVEDVKRHKLNRKREDDRIERIKKELK
jgi:hypothetical protein